MAIHVLKIGCKNLALLGSDNNKENCVGIATIIRVMTKTMEAYTKNIVPKIFLSGFMKWTSLLLITLFLVAIDWFY